MPNRHNNRHGIYSSRAGFRSLVRMVNLSASRRPIYLPLVRHGRQLRLNTGKEDFRPSEVKIDNRQKGSLARSPVVAWAHSKLDAAAAALKRK